MITKEKFIKLVSDYIAQNDRVNEIGNVIGLEVFTCDIVEYGNILFEDLLSFLFNEEAVDDIYWWLYERRFNPELKMWDKDGNEISTETIDDLWEIVKDSQK